MTEVFIKLVNMSISAGWLILAVLVLRLVLAKAPKWTRVFLWAVVAVRLICPFTFKSALSLIPNAEVLDASIMMDWSPSVDTGIAPLNDVVNPIIAQSFTPEPMTSANPLQILIPVWSYIWFIVMIGFVLYTAVSCILLAFRVSTAVRLRDNIYQSEKIASPFVFGIYRPKIYVPFGIDDTSLEYVVMHEMAHIERGDHLLKLFGFAALALHWFNPLVWLAYVLFCRDIELACDERVVRGLDDAGKADYSQALLMCSSGRRVISACPVAFGEIGVKERVKSVLNYRKPAIWVIVVAAVLILLTVVFFLTDPIVLDIADYNWRFSHVKQGEEYLYAAPEREHLFGNIANADFRVSIDGDNLYLINADLDDIVTFRMKQENSTPYSTLYSISSYNINGYAFVSDMKSDADMSAGMVIIGNGEVTFGVPTNEITLVLSVDGSEIYFYHDDNAPKYEPFSAETKPVPAEITEIASHISEEELSFEELRLQYNEIWDYSVKAVNNELQDDNIDWAKKIETAWIDGATNYVIIEVRDYTEEDLKRFEERFSHCSYVIRQIG